MLNRRLTTAALATAGIALAQAPLAGCGSSPARSADREISRDDDARQSLQRRADAQLLTPSAAATRLAPPPGIDPARVLEVDTDANPLALQSLDAALGELARLPASAGARNTDADPEALRAYARGRLALLAGDIETALTELERATRLDPTAPRPWRELGLAQLNANRRTSAIASFRRAVSLGLDDAAVLWLLGRDEMRLGRGDQGLAYLASAARLEPDADDRALTPLIHADLADALAATGRLAAARGSLLLALSLEGEAAARSRFRQEAASLLRRRGQMWIEAGDLSCRLKQYEAALAAYERAAEVPSLDPGSALIRQVHALLRLGRPAEAALRLVDDIRGSGGRVEDRHMPVLEFLARSTEVGPTLSGAVAQIARDAGTSLTPTLASRLVRAAAAVTDAEQARAVLMDHLQRVPGDGDAALALLDTFGPADSAGRMRTLTNLTENAPFESGLYANVLLTHGRGIDAVLESLRRSKDPSARLLEAQLLARLGKPEQARERLMRVVETPPPASTAAQAALIEISLAAGNRAAATAAADRLAAVPAPTAQTTAAYANGLAALGRPADALAALRPVLAADPAPDTLALAAQLALASDQPREAESLLQRLLAADPFDERSYEGLIDLHLPSGPLADESQLAGTIRTLRQRIPSSRVLRGINAQELLSRGLTTEAEEQLLGLLGNGPEHPELLRILASVWERRLAAGNTRDGVDPEAWLRERLAARPESTPLIAALARVLAATGRGEEAVALVGARLEQWPLAELARLRERIVRETLKDPARADAMAIARLESGPRSEASTAELAALLIDNGRYGDAANLIRDELAGEVQRAGPAAAGLIASITAIEPAGLAADVAAAKGALALFDLAAPGISAPDEEFLLDRLLLTALAEPMATDRIVAASREFGQRFPDKAMAAYGRVVSLLGELEDPTAALQYLGDLALNAQPAVNPLMLEWIRLTTLRGDKGDVDHLIDRIDTPQRLAALISHFSLDGAEQPVEHGALRGEFAYTIGLLLGSIGRDDLSEHCYRRTLELDPLHTWASNNLGYALADRGESLDEAERLLEHAYQRLPGNPSIIDSLAWLRYKQNRLRIGNKPGPNGEAGPVFEGAMELFGRAVRTDEGGSNPVILDHFGDAAWRAGDPGMARVMWTRSRMFLRGLLDNRLEDEEPTAREQFLIELASQIDEKLAAAAENRTPPIAPLAPGLPDPVLDPVKNQTR